MARPLLPDDLWTVVEPLLPPARTRPKDGRPPIPDRAALTGILFVLKSGLPWEMLPAEMGCGSGMSCWRRLRDWRAAGVWAALHRGLLERLHGAGQLDWFRASIDSASVPAKKGSEATGPNLTDRGKPGTKRHIVMDGHGTPLGLALSGTNRHDSTMLAPTLDAVPPIRRSRGRPRRRPASCTPTRATTTASAAPNAAAAGSCPASPGAASSATTASAATAGRWSARWLG